MGKPKYDHPTNTFPYKISKRLNLMSVPRRYIVESDEEMPVLSPTGVRKSALRAHVSDRVVDAAWPYIRRFIVIKRMYRNRFSQERLERIDRMIEASNATCYTKMARCVLSLKKQDAKDTRKKKAWSETDWKKHMDYIGHIAGPRKDFQETYDRKGPSKPLEQLLPRINEISQMPEFKVYKRLSQEAFYRDPIKVPPGALKYVISDRVKKLAAPRVIKQE